MDNVTFIDKLSRITCVPIYLLTQLAELGIDLAPETRAHLIEILLKCQLEHDAVLQQGLQAFKELEKNMNHAVRIDEEQRDREHEMAVLPAL